MKILYKKNEKNIVETLSNWEEGGERYNFLLGDASISGIFLLTPIKQFGPDVSSEYVAFADDLESFDTLN